jgi:hypothetical protein
VKGPKNSYLKALVTNEGPRTEETIDPAEIAAF